jgi:transposase-like protein
LGEVAGELGISRSCLRNVEKKELAELRRRDRHLEMESDVPKRAAAYFARENVL